jgi:monofunctional biosynthetic peptidoglycan transglycosylase
MAHSSPGRATQGTGWRLAGRLLLGAAALAFGFVAYVYLTLPDVRPLATTNPTTTAFMALRAREAREAGRPVRRVHHWVPYSRISPHLKRAVLVAEDSAFWQHEGLDYTEIRKSIAIAIERGGRIRGASTITQQLAKNLYLSPSRDPLRKFRELVIARRLEAELPKARIFEIYLNVVEWGDGIWGAEAAARTYFGVSAAALTREQAALLAGALINPILYSPARPSARLLRRQRIILARMGGVEPPAPVLVSAPSRPPAEETAPLPSEPLSVDKTVQPQEAIPDRPPLSDPNVPLSVEPPPPPLTLP